MLHHYFMAMADKFCYSGRCHADSALIVLDFFWNTDSHNTCLFKG